MSTDVLLDVLTGSWGIPYRGGVDLSSLSHCVAGDDFQARSLSLTRSFSFVATIIIAKGILLNVNFALCSPWYKEHYHISNAKFYPISISILLYSIGYTNLCSYPAWRSSAPFPLLPFPPHQLAPSAVTCLSQQPWLKTAAALYNFPEVDYSHGSGSYTTTYGRWWVESGGEGGREGGKEGKGGGREAEEKN